MAINLTVELTESERSTYEAKRRGDGVSLPTYFNAEAGTDVAITRDFEAFLILSDAGVRSNAVTWLSDTSSRVSTDSLLDGLTTLMLEREVDDSITELAVYTRELIFFSAFRDTLSAGKFATVGEVQTLINDAQLGIEATVRAKERSKQRRVVTTVLQDRLTTGNIVEERVKQAESWAGVLLLY